MCGGWSVRSYIIKARLDAEKMIVFREGFIMIKISFDKNSLIKQLKTMYSVVVFDRGKKYYQKGMVGKLKISNHRTKEKIKITADVYGSDTYNTEMVFNFLTNRFSNSECDCPYDWGKCKHSLAVGLKFIDIWEETCQIDNEFKNFEEIKKLLISFAKISKNNDDEKYEYTSDDLAYEDDEYCGEEDALDITDKNDAIDYLDKQEKKKERLKKLLQMIGINAEDLSAEALGELESKVDSKSRNKEIKKIKSVNLPEIEKKKGIVNLTNKYHILFNTEYTPRLEIARNDSSMSYWRNEPENILKEERAHLTLSQRELLKSLNETNFWYGSNIEWGDLFELAKDSGFEVFLNSKLPKNKLTFNENPSKIEAEIYQEETRNQINYGEVMEQKDFSFKLNGDFYKKKSIYSFCGSVNVVRIIGNEVQIHPITKKLSNIVARIFEAGRNYHEGYYQYQRQENFVWTDVLNEEEIIEINEIMEDARKYFDCKTDLSETFQVKKFKKIGPAILVDYDSEKHNLCVRAAIDYGFSKIDVAHTMYKSTRGGIASFQRKDFKNRSKFHIKINGQEIHYADVSHKEEKKLFSKLHLDEKYGFTKTLKCVRENPKKIIHYHENHWPQIKELNYPIEFSRDKFEFFQENFKADFDVDMNAAQDWLAFDVDCYLGRDRIALADLKSYLKNKEEFIRMNDGRMLRISNWEELERFILMLESFYQRENGSFEGRIYHAPELENIFVNSEYYSAKVADGFKKFISEAQNGRPLKKVNLPVKINKTLRDYQKDGISWFHFLRKYRFAGVLADDMGLGKTLQALTLLEMNKVKEKPSVVICPKTLLFNWEDEARKFFPNLKTLIIEGAPKERAKNIEKIKNYDLIITSYSTIKKDGAIYENKKIKFNYCFLDEAQFIKNHKTQNAQAVKKIDADYKLALTGTPLENSVSEIWSVFDFLMPGFLGNYNNFTKRFLTPIMKHNDFKALTELRKKTECFMLRRTKSEVLKELPPKIEQILVSELTEAQNILYQEILANVKTEIEKTVSEKGFAKSQIHILAGLMKLRQVCNHPTLLLKKIIQNTNQLNWRVLRS